MPRSRVCLDCPAIGAWKRGRCPTHERVKDKSRGTPTQRGYGSTVLDTPLGRMTFDRCRAKYQHQLNTGQPMACADHCGRTINPHDWHLGHADDNRDVIIGPLTTWCNLHAAGKARHGIAPSD
jgi:hypothetical protein